MTPTTEEARELAERLTDNNAPDSQAEAAAAALTAMVDEVERLKNAMEGDHMGVAAAAYRLGRGDQSAGYVACDPRVILSRTYAALKGGDQ